MFPVVLEGSLEAVRIDGAQGGHGGQAERVAHFGPGQFVGELFMLTGQRPYLTVRASSDGRILLVPPDEFRRLLATHPTVADIIFGAFVARREFLRTSSAALAIRIIGSRYSPEALALRTFAARNRLAHTWVDLEDAEDVGGPPGQHGAAAGRHPGGPHPRRRAAPPHPGEFAEHLGLTYHPSPGTSSTWWWWAPVRPVWPPRSTGRPRASTPSRSTPWPRRSGRRQLAHRELRRLPQRDLRSAT